SFVRPCWLVGQNGSDYTKTINEQDETLKIFRNGQCNVMIATNVVEEGLDVPQCSYVIRYEYVSNEVGTIQARGRARTENSAYYLITAEESLNHLREEMNRYKEEEMDLALSEWKNTLPDVIKRIIQREKINLNEIQISEAMKTAHRSSIRLSSTIVNGNLSCRSCGYYLGEIDWLRKRKHIYFVYDEELFKRVEIERKNKPEHKHEIQLNGKVLCGNRQCREKLGGAQLFTDRPDIQEMCALKCDALKFCCVDENNELSTTFIKKKWADLPFTIVDLEEIKPPVYAEKQ
ncbi:unnamed protein product, partial [Didymodactylos carnosus]